MDIQGNMKDKHEKCIKFFNDLVLLLNESYEVVASCNRDESLYLIPKGSIGQLSYYGKPMHSFRLSDHWNWYSPLSKCNLTYYIQCLCADLPYCKKRKSESGPSSPIIAYQVSLFMDDGQYHCVYGEKFDRKTKKWSWVEQEAKEVVKLLGGRL